MVTRSAGHPHWARRWLPTRCAGMETLGSGLVVLLNGAVDIVGAATSPVVAALIVSMGSLVWFARLEADALDREAASKPEVGVH